MSRTKWLILGGAALAAIVIVVMIFRSRPGVVSTPSNRDSVLSNLFSQMGGSNPRTATARAIERSRNTGAGHF